MAEQDDSADRGSRPGGGAGGDGGAGAGGGGGGGGRSRSRNRNRNRNRPSAQGAQGTQGTPAAQPAQSTKPTQTGQTGQSGRTGQQARGASAGGGGRSSSNARRRGGQQRNGRSRSGGGGGGGNRSSGGNRSGSGGAGARSTSSAANVSTATPTRASAPASVSVHEVQERPGLGATQVFPSEVAANRRRVVVLCAWTAVIPAVLLGALVAVTVSFVAGAVALVVVALLWGYGVWRVAPRVSLRRIGAVPAPEHVYPRYYNITEGLCATFGLRMPMLHIVRDPVPNACALGRDARSSDLVVTEGLLRLMGPIEVEGVIAHELAHVKRGDNGVSSIGITLASLFGGEATLRRCIGARASREYRADVVGASTVRYPRGLLDALRLMAAAPDPPPGSVFAAPRFGATRWVWIDPSVGHRGDELVPGDLDATSVRSAALSEW